MRTFPQVLQENTRHSDRAVTFLRANGTERRVSFPDLWLEACRRANALAALGLKRGDRVALVLPEPDEFVLTFMGCLTGGFVAVPMYPPQTLAKMETYGDTVRHILAASGASLLVTSESLAALMKDHLGTEDPANETTVVVETALREGSEAPPAVPVELDELAFLQFTSGSTNKPKGVKVTFRNLAANAKAIMVDGLQSTPEDKGVSWLPLYHDMGLIGFVVAPLYTLVQVMFIPTSAFIRRPSIWLDAIHRFRATITFAPNFAFALAARAVTDTQSKDWDLSSMRALGCGAEPIQADVLRTFLDRFSRNGLRPSCILPSYGMAEATLAITFADLKAELRTLRLDVDALRQGKAEDTTAETGLELVSCGRPFPDHEVQIVASERRVSERQVGELWVRGPSVTSGYFMNPEASEEAFESGWLKTGDLAFQADGEVFICGRAKDLIILNGRNYYPQDIERSVSQAPGVRDGQCVAFGVLGADGGEHCVIVAEAKLGGRAGTTADVITQIIQHVRAEIGIVPGEVHLIRRGTLPKTSSGKVRRREAKRRLELGELELIGDSDVSTESLPPPSCDGAMKEETEATSIVSMTRPLRSEASDGIQ